MALLSSGGSHAPTTTGINGLIGDHCSFEGHRPAVSGQRASIRGMYDALTRHSGSLSRQDLEPYYKPVNNGDPTKGRYGTHQFSRFWDDVAVEQLANLPGVEQASDGFQFIGIDADDVDAETRSLEELREDPRTEARNDLDERVGPHSDDREILLKLWDHVAEIGETTTDDLNGDFHVPDVDEHADVLADLLHIECETVHPPSPEEIEIATYADILEARKRVEADPVERWTYTGE